jgi:hypothetical protein
VKYKTNSCTKKQANKGAKKFANTKKSTRLYTRNLKASKKEENLVCCPYLLISFASDASGCCCVCSFCGLVCRETHDQGARRSGEEDMEERG